MKYFMLTLVIVLYQNQSVTCSFIDFVSTRFNNLAVSLASTVKHIRDHMRNLFISREVIHPAVPHYQAPPDVQIKKTFTHFVETTAAEDELELPEYTSLKSEPTALMSTPQLAMLHGRRVESHVVTARDGYILTIHRISPTPKLPHKYVNQTILLHHGLLGSSADWILLGSEKSLPYKLSDAGYDVWMANARGNYYSRGHAWKNVESVEFWKFSWQEMGEVDLPAVIDYIRKNKKLNYKIGEKIDFVGHSMGATALLVLLSTLPNYNEYLRIGILMAPLAYMTNVNGPLKAVMSMVACPPRQLLNIIGTKEFVPMRRIPKQLALKYCSGPMLFCCNPLYFISGGIPEANAWNASFIARVLYHVPAGGSTDTILHYLQLVKNGRFHKFNDINNEFKLNRITMPIALINSEDDWLATTPDVLRLFFSITNPIDHYIIRGKNFSHTDFVWGLEADEAVFPKVFEILDNGLNATAIRSNEVQNDSE